MTALLLAFGCGVVACVAVRWTWHTWQDWREERDFRALVASPVPPGPPYRPEDEEGTFRPDTDTCVRCRAPESAHTWHCTACRAVLAPDVCDCGKVHMPAPCAAGCEAGARLYCGAAIAEPGTTAQR